MFLRHDLRHANYSSRLGRRIIFVTGPIGFAAILGLLISRNFGESPLNGDQLVKPGTTMVFAVDDWVGRELPLLPYITTDAHLSRGEWHMLIFDHDCKVCRRRLRFLASHPPSGRWIFVEIPPTDPQRLNIPVTATYGKLSNKYDWVIATPCEFDLHDGVVVRASEPVSTGLGGML